MSKGEKLRLTNLLTFANIKLGGNIPQLNMPYAITCRPDAPCFRECYCTHGNMAFSTVRNSHKNKLELYKADPKAFFEQIDRELSFVSYKYFRYHSSGDIVDAEYLGWMCWLARKHRETLFLCFTKKYELVNEYLNDHVKPSNLILVLSNWGEWKVDNPHNLPTSYVDFGKGNEDIPRFAYECPGSCGNCENHFCWHLGKGQSVFFHKH